MHTLIQLGDDSKLGVKSSRSPYVVEFLAGRGHGPRDIKKASCSKRGRSKHWNRASVAEI